MTSIDFSVVGAIARKDLRAYLGNPTGYVFLTLFIGVTAAAGFLQDGFFARNLADLALLNRLMPGILVFFVPALTMNAWAEERRQGTDEALLTLPVRDAEVVLGKYLGALGMFTASLVFSLSNVAVLAYLGDPDPGLMISTYMGYWLMGVLLVAVGLLGSMLTSNATVAFVLGLLGCAALVFAGTAQWAAGLLGCALIALTAALIHLVARGHARGIGSAAGAGAGLGALLWLGGGWPRFTYTFELLSVGQRFYSFGEGVIRLGDALYFAGAAGVLLYICAFLLGRRHW